MNAEALKEYGEPESKLPIKSNRGSRAKRLVSPRVPEAFGQEVHKIGTF